jgi:hypothetical protein
MRPALIESIVDLGNGEHVVAAAVVLEDTLGAVAVVLEDTLGAVVAAAVLMMMLQL